MQLWNWRLCFGNAISATFGNSSIRPQSGSLSAPCLAGYNYLLNKLHFVPRLFRGRTGFDRIDEAQVACRG